MDSLQVQQSFDYSTVDAETAEFLKLKEVEIKDILTNSATEVGKKLKDVQEKLSKHGSGSFGDWIETTLKFSRQTGYNLINRFDMFVKLFDNQNLLETFENLPKLLSYEVSKPSAYPELTEKVLSGDVTTHKEYKDLEKQLKQAVKEKQQSESKVLETEQKLISKEKMISSLINKPAEIQEVFVDNPELKRQIDMKGIEIQQLKQRLGDYLQKIETLNHLGDKEKEINNTYKEMEKLKRQQSEGIKELDETSKVFHFINTTKEYIKKEMLHIPTLTTHYSQSDTMKKEIKLIIEVLENFNYALKQKFNIGEN